MLEWMIDNVVISKVDTLTYVIPCKAEKHMSYVELIGTTECVMLSDMSH